MKIYICEKYYFSSLKCICFGTLSLIIKTYKMIYDFRMVHYCVVLDMGLVCLALDMSSIDSPFSGSFSYSDGVVCTWMISDFLLNLLAIGVHWDQFAVRSIPFEPIELFWFCDLRVSIVKSVLLSLEM